MDIGLALLVALAGYLIGSLSFARIIGRFVAPHADLTDEVPFPTKDPSRPFHMRSVSATTLSKRASPWAGFTAGVLDVLKVFLPAVVLRQYPGGYYYLIFALMAMVGHIWPVYYRFRGGRGMSVAFGAFLVVDPLGALVSWVAGTALDMFVLRDTMMTFVGWMWLMIPWVWFRTHDLWQTLLVLAINVLFAIALIPEAKVHLQYRREGVFLSFEQGMQGTHMGKGLYRMAVRMGLMKEVAPPEDPQP